MGPDEIISETQSERGITFSRKEVAWVLAMADAATKLRLGLEGDYVVDRSTGYDLDSVPLDVLKRDAERLGMYPAAVETVTGSLEAVRTRLKEILEEEYQGQLRRFLQQALAKRDPV
jgi:hypothetical protein